MTPALDRIEAAADRIKHDEFLADKKRVMFFFWFIVAISSDDAANIRHRPPSSNHSNSVRPHPLDCPLTPTDILIHAPILAMFPLYLFRLPRPFPFPFLLTMPHFPLLAPFLHCYS